MKKRYIIIPVVLILAILSGIVVIKYHVDFSVKKQSNAYSKQTSMPTVNQEFEAYGISQTELQRAQMLKITDVGDSITALSKKKLKQLMPQAIINAKVGRQLPAGIEILKQLKDQGQLSENVVIGLGTNGNFTWNQMDEVMSIIGERHVFWVNVYAPTRSWESDVNEMLEKAQKRYANLTVIDWHDYAQDQWLYDDQIHPTEEGTMYYSAFVVKNIVDRLH
ncbi:MAG: hypothetical protein Q3960_01420 [Lactobacillus sp.]|nr:hypothetical protein [Lactobacillus sp.]